VFKNLFSHWNDNLLMKWVKWVRWEDSGYWDWKDEIVSKLRESFNIWEKRHNFWTNCNACQNAREVISPISMVYRRHSCPVCVQNYCQNVWVAVTSGAKFKMTEMVTIATSSKWKLIPTKVSDTLRKSRINHRIPIWDFWMTVDMYINFSHGQSESELKIGSSMRLDWLKLFFFHQLKP
jgi:hypothetical protein